MGMPVGNAYTAGTITIKIMFKPMSASHDWVPPGIVRQRPLQLLTQALHYPVTLLLAPAGSGKSVLLQQWLVSEGIAPVFLQVQNRDNDFGSFMRRFLGEIRRYDREFDIAWFNPLPAVADNIATLAEYFAQALHHLPHGTVIVLDDVHLIDDAQTRQLLADVLLISPSHVHFILLSRQADHLPLTRLELQGRLCCIEQHDLQCSVQDVCALYATMEGTGLNEGDFAFIQHMTEGWMVGVKLALLACQRSGRAALQEFHGHVPEMIDYFGPVVFNALPLHLQQFYLCSAVLDKFNAPLCDFVLQRNDSAQVLARIRSRELFILPIPGKPGWYRYHALLQRFLVRQFAWQNSAQYCALQSRAAEYFAAQQQYDLALNYARESADGVLFRDLLKTACAEWRRQGEYGDIIKWLDPFPEDELLNCQDYLRAMVVALTQQRCFSRARYFLSHWQARAAQFQHGAEIGLLLRSNLDMFEQDMAYVPGADLYALAQRIELPGVAGLSQLLLAYHSLMHGQLSDALRYARHSKELLLQSGHTYVASYTDLISAMCNRYSARVLDARNAVYGDFATTDKNSPAWLNRAIAMLVVFYEENNQQDALALCEEIFSHITASSATEAIFTVHLIMSRILFRRGEHGRAQRLLQQLEIILRMGNYPRFITQLEQEYMRNAYVLAQYAHLEELAARFLPADISEHNGADEITLRKRMAWVYVLLARRQQHRAQRVLRSLAHQLRDTQWLMLRMKIDAALCVLSDDDTQSHQALVHLAQTYGIASFCCTVFDEVPGLLSLVRRLQHSGVLRVPEKYLRHYQDLFGSRDTPAQAVIGSESLTQKEQEILHYLCAGLSNSAISTKTGVALSTTKWHLKNIYAKLGVNNRAQAIVQQQALLSTE